MTNLVLDIQRAVNSEGLPADNELERWAAVALERCSGNVEMTIRLVDAEESTHLNATYRNKSGPTNVLSFPFEAPPGIESDLLGDLVICAPVVSREAAEQGKSDKAHWAHMVIHGVLHLQGYDHQTDNDAARMESLERTLMSRLGFDDPYRLIGKGQRT